MDCAFLLDIVLNFLTGFVESNRGGVVLEPAAVAKRYLRTWALLDAVGKYFPPNTFCLPDCPYETDTFFFIVSASIPFELIFPDASRGNDLNVIIESSYESSHESSYAPSPPPLGNYDSSHGDNSIYRHAKVVRVIKLIRLLKLFRVLRGAYFPLTTFRLPGLPIRD